MNAFHQARLQDNVISRRGFLGTLLAGTTAVVAAPAYARYVEPRWLEITFTRIDLGLGRADKPLRLLHLSDLHLSDVVPLSFIQRAVEEGLARKPDLVCLTGDFISKNILHEEAYRAVLGALPRAAPTVAVMGNHDGGNWARVRRGYATSAEIRRFVASCGITLLHNTGQQMTLDATPFACVGVGDSWAGEFQAEQAFPARAQGPTILLSHNPDTKKLVRDYAWDLMLSGHTHGGQVVLPGLGAPIVPVEDTRFLSGLYDWEGRQIFITRGVGNVRGIRFNCRPEVSLLDLV